MMRDKQTFDEKLNQHPCYEIRLKGHLDNRWAERFEGLTMTLEETGNTLLSGALADQPALHGILKKVRDLGLPLLSVNLVQTKRANSKKAGLNSFCVAVPATLAHPRKTIPEKEKYRIRRNEMRTLQKMGGISSLICAATYLVSMGLLFTLLAPFMDPAIGFAQFMDFFLANQTTIFIWHLLMYLVNGVFLVILALALYDRLKVGSPVMGQAATIFGLIWAALVFASGFITLYGWEALASLYHGNPAQAATLKLALDMVTMGLDHSDRFLGCLWVMLVSWAALRVGVLTKPLNYLGLVIGIPGIISTAFPALTELGIAFGLGIIVWWIWLGIVLLRSRPGLVVEKPASVGLAPTTLTVSGK